MMKKALSTALLIAVSIFSLSAATICSVDSLTLEQKAAKMLIVGVDGYSLSSTNPVIEDISSQGVSGIILFERNIAPAKPSVDSRAILTTFIADLQSKASYPLFMAVDQEGGRVNRLKEKYGFAPMPSHFAVGQKNCDTYSRKVASTIASEVASVGFNLNFVPSVDVNVNPNCPVIGKVERSFSSNPDTVSHIASIYIEEHHKKGLLTSVKHFPGHGSSASDSHNGFTDVTTSWSRPELEPFKALIDNGLCDMVMVSHTFNSTIDSLYPATLSNKTVNGLLRSELGWNGVVVSDDMQMRAISDNYGFDEAIVLGVNAGIDLFIVSGNIKKESYDISDRFIKIVVDGVKSGAIKIETINNAVQRIEHLRAKLNK